MFTLHVFSCVELLMISAGWHISTVVSCILWQRPALVRERAFCLWVLKLKASERGCKQWHPQGQTGLYNAVMSGCTGPLHSTAHSLVRDPFWDYTTHTHTHTRALNQTRPVPAVTCSPGPAASAWAPARRLCRRSGSPGRRTRGWSGRPCWWGNSCGTRTQWHQAHYLWPGMQIYAKYIHNVTKTLWYEK